MLELFDDSGDILGGALIAAVPMGATPMLNSLGASRELKRLLKKKSFLGGEL